MSPRRAAKQSLAAAAAQFGIVSLDPCNFVVAMATRLRKMTADCGDQE